MSDLSKQIRDHYRSMATPISTEEIVERADRSSVAGGRSRQRPAWTAAAVAAAAILILGLVPLVNYVATNLGPDDAAGSTTLTTVTSDTSLPTTTLPPEPRETELGVPEKTDRVAGQWSFRADIGAEGAAGLPGVSGRPMLPSADGFYWTFGAGDQIRSSPAIFGETVMFGSDDGRLYGLVVTSGPPACGPLRLRVRWWGRRSWRR